MDDNGRWSSSLSDVAGNTLPEHHSALALLQQLDHAWFLDNLLKPRIGLINAFCPSSDPPLSPYQSIELVDATNGKWGSSARHDRPHRGDMPCTRFEVLSHSEAPARAVDLSESSSNLQLNDQQASVPPGGTEQPLTPRRHVSASCPLAHVVLCPPTRALTLPIKEDFYNVKEIQVNQVSRAPHFETIASGKPLRVSLVDTHLPQPAFRVRKARRRSSRSMTAIEFDEVQGFTDLGFQFSQDDLTPRIVTMFPALKHKLGEDGELGVRQVIHSKPKQSSLEAWLIRGSTVPLHHGQIPSTSEDMKEHLKFWARAVASTVRQEC